MALDQLIEDHADTFVVIRYHVNWPQSNDPYYIYNSGEVNQRRGYYGVNAVPAFKIDGFIDGGSYPSYWSRIFNRFWMDAPLEITLSGTFDDQTRLGTLNVHLDAVEDAYWDSLYIRIALTESDLYYPGSNGVQYHNQTMRDMIPNGNGTPFEISWGETYDQSFDFSVPSPLVPENCELVVWVQSDYMREVYQAAVVNVTDIQTGIDDPVAELPQQTQLNQNYPNPFNASTNIAFSLDRSQQVNLDVYDIAGRKVAELLNTELVAGSHTVNWNGIGREGNIVASGVYFYRLATDSGVSVKQMTLMK